MNYLFASVSNLLSYVTDLFKNTHLICTVHSSDNSSLLYPCHSFKADDITVVLNCVFVFC